MFGLCFGALVAPDKRRANDFIALVEQYRAMHLPGKTDARDGVGGFSGRLNGFADSDGRGAPPVPGILFSPARMRAGEGRVLFGTGSNNAARFVKNEGARSTGSHINAKSSDKASRLLLDLLSAGRDCGAKLSRREICAISGVDYFRTSFGGDILRLVLEEIFQIAAHHQVRRERDLTRGTRTLHQELMQNTEG